MGGHIKELTKGEKNGKPVVLLMKDIRVLLTADKLMDIIHNNKVVILQTKAGAIRLSPVSYSD